MIKNRFFLLLLLFVFCILCFSTKRAEVLRTWVVNTASPSKRADAIGDVEEKLVLENHQLHLQVEQLKEWFFEQQHLAGLWQTLGEKSEDPFFKRRRAYLTSLLDKQLHALPAQVIFREPISWSSTVWLNIGERDNRDLGFQVVAPNSPVVIGKAIVGVVELVSEKKCRVRLITDRKLKPSVRAIRGGEQNRLLVDKITTIAHLLSEREDLYGAEDLSRVLTGFSEQLDVEEKDLYLAKGQLQGTSSPMWRVPGQTLKGIGFNYDFSDEEGPARDLRTGAYEGGQDPLIKVGDLLVTTGVDGVFPPDLHVGIVSKILPLHEGGCTYGLEAAPIAPDLNKLMQVFVLPPL